MNITQMWPNQQDGYDFAIQRPSALLDYDMGTGKTLITIHMIMARPDVKKVLIVCPKKVMDVWPSEFGKHVDNRDPRGFVRPAREQIVITSLYGTCVDKAEILNEGREEASGWLKCIVIMNYDIIWRKPLDKAIRKFGFDMVVLDESHRAKSAGSKASKFLALLAKSTKYRLCLSGTPMANSPLDVYGQFRFLDSTIFGTRYDDFQNTYAIMGGPENNWPIGYKNQDMLMQKFRTITVSCKMDDIKDRLRLPDKLPPVVRYTELSAKDAKMTKELTKEFIAECESGGVVATNNVLTKVLRLLQITSGYCMVQDDLLSEPYAKMLNTTKEELLRDVLEDLPYDQPLVIFCLFSYDIETCRKTLIDMSTAENPRRYYELTGAKDELREWRECRKGVLLVQIQAGAEGVDMTLANTAIYYSRPHSLALYEQSQARLYRPGQTRPVSFIHLIVHGTMDEHVYNALVNKQDLITEIKEGRLDWGYLKK